MIRQSSLASKLFAVAALVVLPTSALGCSSSSHKGANANTAATNAPNNAPSGASASAVSGSWSGEYSGTFSGTFKLTWQATGSNLTGSIQISSLGGGDMPINGTLNGNNISFGTVGSQAIQYTGSVSGSSMSGDWKLQAGGKAAGSGSWHASKS
jgi:hypothetical protein